MSEKIKEFIEKYANDEKEKKFLEVYAYFTIIII